MSIFQNNDIDTIVLSYLDLLDDYFIIIQVNRYYHKLISNHLQFKLWKELNLPIEKNQISFNKFNKDNLFIKACRTNNLLYRYFITKLKNICTDVYEYAFQVTCGSGYQDVAQWLITTNKCIHIDANNFLAFRCACTNGHLNIAKWLINLCAEPDFCPTAPIDIHANYDQAFRYSCENGHIDTAQWLINLSMQDDFGLIDIHALGEWAFQKSCKNGHLDVAYWLLDLSMLDDFSTINGQVIKRYVSKYSYENGKLCVEWKK
jgi:Ankyrin repeats (many copies)